MRKFLFYCIFFWANNIKSSIWMIVSCYYRSFSSTYFLSFFCLRCLLVFCNEDHGAELEDGWLMLLPQSFLCIKKNMETLTLWPEICRLSQVRLWPSRGRQRLMLGINQPTERQLVFIPPSTNNQSQEFTSNTTDLHCYIDVTFSNPQKSPLTTKESDDSDGFTG